MCRLLFQIALLVSMLLAAACGSRPNDVIRFEEIVSDDVNVDWLVEGDNQTDVRSRWAHYNPAAIGLLASEGAAVEFELFEDTVLPITVTSVAETELGQTQIIALIDDQDFSVFWLTSSKSGLVGRAQTMDRMFSIATVEEGVIRITEYDQGAFPPDIELDEEATPEFHRRDFSDERSFMIGQTAVASAIGRRQVPEIRVMVLLPSPAFGPLCNNDRLLADGAASISLGINQVWRASARSEVVAACVRYIPEGKAFVDFLAADQDNDTAAYIATGEDPYVDLNWLRNSPSVRRLRDQNLADLVALIVPVLSSCGMAPTNAPPILANEEMKAFAVVRADCVEGNYSTQHELGHLMGMKHDRHAYSSDVAGACNYGYQCRKQRDYLGRTVMASKTACERIGYPTSACKIRFPFHSTTAKAGDVAELDPTWSCGIPCSANTVDDWTGAAHNYIQLQDAAPIVAQYR